MIDKKLIAKYDKPLPRYTSYPPATSFHAAYTGDDYKKSVRLSNQQEPQGISLYLHIPFCPRLCLYCGCTTLITRQDEMIASYLEALKKEITMVAEWLDLSRPVTQIHWGGGTPNALSARQVGDIMALINSTFNIETTTEIAIECNPAHLSLEYLDALFKMGFNRISLGIQDFNEEVLNTVHRDLPSLPVKTLTQYIRRQGAGVNYDFIYGLPGQTEASFAQTIQQALELKPDRLVTFSYAHVPWVKPHQNTLEKAGLPIPEEKLAMFTTAYQMIVDSGDYVAIGLDHFALKQDHLSSALSNHQLHRNFQGYCTRETTGQVYAFGMSAISQLFDSYAQNTKNIKAYIDLINSGQPAIEKGYRLPNNELIIKEVITELMCNNRLDWQEVAQRLQTDVAQLKATTRYSEEKMQPYVADGLLLINNDTLNITESGRFTIRNIVAELDPKLNSDNQRFSKSI
jgi:oxygen-independent coproporphyrinogen III oxidase